MRFEWVIYWLWNSDSYPKYLEVLQNLPDDIRRELLQDERFQNYLAVEANKKDVIEYLDRALDIGIKRDVRKEYFLEIDKNEIEHFSHFEIAPRDLEIDREFFVDLQHPTCESFYCYVGMKLLSPVRMKASKAKSIGIAELGFGAFAKRIYLVVSAELKDIFDAEGVTGLEYEPVELTDADSYDEMPEGFRLPYMARISNVIYQEADKVSIKKWVCRKHRVMLPTRGGTSSPVFINMRLPRKAICDADFMEIGGIVVGGITYNLKYNSRFIVTRKVLEILLNNKIKGLMRMVFNLNAKFIPVRFDEVTVF